MARYEHLPIWRDATRLLLVLEQSVRQFARYHKYTLGSGLAEPGNDGVPSCDSGQQRAPRPQPLCQSVGACGGRFKSIDSTGQGSQAFASFKQFQDAAELVSFRQTLLLPLGGLKSLRRRLRGLKLPHCFIAEQGYHKRGLKRRVLRLRWQPVDHPAGAPSIH